LYALYTGTDLERLAQLAGAGFIGSKKPTKEKKVRKRKRKGEKRERERERDEPRERVSREDTLKLRRCFIPF
jgi:hypothetical protein